MTTKPTVKNPTVKRIPPKKLHPSKRLPFGTCLEASVAVVEFSVFSVELVRVEVSVVVVVEVVLLLGSSDVEGSTADVAGLSDEDASEVGAFDGVASEGGASDGDPSEGVSSEVESPVESLSPSSVLLSEAGIVVSFVEDSFSFAADRVVESGWFSALTGAVVDGAIVVLFSPWSPCSGSLSSGFCIGLPSADVGSKTKAKAKANTMYGSFMANLFLYYLLKKCHLDV